MSLLDDVYAASDPRENKADFINYYQEKYGAGWKRQAAIDLSGTTDSGSRAYQSVMRNFQGQRLAQQGNTPKWRALSEKLAPKPPENGYHIYGVVYVKYSDGECEERDVDEYISGSEAGELAGMSTASAMAQGVVDHYNTDPFGGESHASIINCESPDLHVEAA